MVNELICFCFPWGSAATTLIGLAKLYSAAHAPPYPLLIITLHKSMTNVISPLPTHPAYRRTKFCIIFFYSSATCNGRVYTRFLRVF